MSAMLATSAIEVLVNPLPANRVVAIDRIVLFFDLFGILTVLVPKLTDQSVSTIRGCHRQEFILHRLTFVNDREWCRDSFKHV